MKKLAIVTGGSRGIGLGIVRELGADGFRVAIVSASPAERHAATLDALAAERIEALYLQGDMGALDDIQRCVDTIRARCGRIDVLVNNAGMAPEVRADLLEMSPESFARVWEVNCRGTMFMSQAVARLMLDQEPCDGRRGVIVNIGSISAETVSINRGEYCLSKAGVSMLTKLYADRLAASGINVYEVRPGIVATDMTAGVRQKYDALIARGGVPIPRWGLPRDIGLAVAALCSGRFPYTTGQVINVDGGIHLQRL